jgi:hypothetical protein
VLTDSLDSFAKAYIWGKLIPVTSDGLFVSTVFQCPHDILLGDARLCYPSISLSLIQNQQLGSVKTVLVLRRLCFLQHESS